jgi:2-methylcitrate dehydratase PrpD
MARLVERDGAIVALIGTSRKAALSKAREMEPVRPHGPSPDDAVPPRRGARAGPVDFLLDADFGILPVDVVAQTKRCLLDLVGVAASGRRTALADIACDFAARHLGAGSEGGSARLLLDGRPASAPGVAFAGAAIIDSFDAHDGHALTKGHAGVAVFPAALAFHQLRPAPDGRFFLADLAVGYELAIRAGIVLHATACDYHTSGTWNALACAMIGARRLGLSRGGARHALGIAEFHGPRSPMMRCIDHPTMVKDGSAQGALAGTSAALLAGDGFTGAPALLMEDPRTRNLWDDLGERWRILELYFKPHPVCRWAQPAMEAALSLQRQHGLSASAIRAVTVETFAAAARLATRHPETTEEAQYSLPYPLAAALVRGVVGAAELRSFSDPEVRRLADAVTLEVADAFEAHFPAERWARVRFRLLDGTELVSTPATARGDANDPLPDAELRDKFLALCAGSALEGREQLVATLVDDLDRGDGYAELLGLLCEPDSRARSVPTLGAEARP